MGEISEKEHLTPFLSLTPRLPLPRRDVLNEAEPVEEEDLTSTEEELKA